MLTDDVSVLWKSLFYLSKKVITLETPGLKSVYCSQIDMTFFPSCYYNIPRNHVFEDILFSCYPSADLPVRQSLSSVHYVLVSGRGGGIR